MCNSALVTSGHAAYHCGLPAALLKGWRSWLPVKDAQHQARTDSLTHSQIPQASSVVHLSRSALKPHYWHVTACISSELLRSHLWFCSDIVPVLTQEAKKYCFMSWRLPWWSLSFCAGMDWSVRMRWWRISCVPTRCCSVRWGLVLFTTSRRWLTWSQHSVNTALDL